MIPEHLIVGMAQLPDYPLGLCKVRKRPTRERMPALIESSVSDASFCSVFFKPSIQRGLAPGHICSWIAKEQAHLFLADGEVVQVSDFYFLNRCMLRIS